MQVEDWVRPSKFKAYQERRLGRELTQEEADAIEAAQNACADGKRDTVKAMWKALKTVGARTA
jgi:hypothetical protein